MPGVRGRRRIEISVVADKGKVLFCGGRRQLAV